MALLLLKVQALMITARPVAFIGDEIAGCAPAQFNEAAPVMWPFRIFRGSSDFNEQYLEQVRRMIAESCDLLQNKPPPNTFAGRKTQEPFPTEDDLLDRAISVKEFRPPK